MVTIRIPAPLRSLTADKSEISAEGATIAEVIDAADRNYPGLKGRLLDEKGSLRRYINIFHNDQDIRFTGALTTPLKEGDRLAIVPAIAGGR